MEYFSIFGERCTGTHFVQYALLNNFNIKYEVLREKPIKEKHFFGFNEDMFNSDIADKTLFIYVVRDPVDWIDSFFKRLHHVPPENKVSIENFIYNKFYSIYELGDKIGDEIMEDRNMITKERYRNIFELRKVKNDYMMNYVKNKVKNFLILKYEDLRDDYENTLNKIKNQFNLTQIQPKYVRIEKYKGTYSLNYFKKPILLEPHIIAYIKCMIDLNQEKKLGYLLDM
jgi:hypothetical protein